MEDFHLFNDGGKSVRFVGRLFSFATWGRTIIEMTEIEHDFDQGVVETNGKFVRVDTFAIGKKDWWESDVMGLGSLSEIVDAEGG